MKTLGLSPSFVWRLDTMTSSVELLTARYETTNTLLISTVCPYRSVYDHGSAIINPEGHVFSSVPVKLHFGRLRLTWAFNQAVALLVHIIWTGTKLALGRADATQVESTLDKDNMLYLSRSGSAPPTPAREEEKEAEWNCRRRRLRGHCINGFPAWSGKAQYGERETCCPRTEKCDIGRADTDI